MCTHIHTWKERVGMLNRVLLITRSWMCAHPENKAITQLKQCRTDRVLSEMLRFRITQATIRRESIVYMKCPWFGLPGGWTLLCAPWSQAGRYSYYLCSCASGNSAGWRSWDPGRRLETDSGAATWEWGMYPAMPKVGWDSLGPRHPSIPRELTVTEEL